MNSIFHAGDETVVRVGPSRFGARAEIAWLDLMSSLDIRVPRLRHDIIEIDGLCVAAIERVHPSGVVDWHEVGAMIERVHSIDAGQVPGLPACVDFAHWRVVDVVADVADLIDVPALDGMHRCLERWEGWQAAAQHDVVVCHGDVHPGNVMPTADGPVLLDWDLRCLAPSGWDHAALMTWTERWDGAPGLYEAFAAGYGRSLRGEWMAEAFAEVRLLVATLMRLRAGRTDDAAAHEAQRRLRYWRGDVDAPRWRPQ
jgi:aminoglycoside phosphotransferase (APT) family kinase protein